MRTNTIEYTDIRPVNPEVVSPCPVRKSTQIVAGRARLDGSLIVPSAAAGIVLFACASDLNQFGRRNRVLVQVLVNARFATLLFDLLTREEQTIDLETGEYRADIDLLARRVIAAIDSTAADEAVSALPVICFGESMSAPACLIGAAERPRRVHAVVLRGGRPDRAGFALAAVQAPTLLIVDGQNGPLIALNRAAMRYMRAPVELNTVPMSVNPVLEESGALDPVSHLALDWCSRQLQATNRDESAPRRRAPH